MPAPRPIMRSFENPMALGGLAIAAGQASNSQMERDRYEQQRARDLQFLQGEMDRRTRIAEMDAQHGALMSQLGAQAQMTRMAANPATRVGTFNQFGQVPEGVPPEAMRLQNAMAATGRAGQAADAQRGAPTPGQQVRDPYAPDMGFSALRGPRGVTYTAGGQQVSSMDPATAQEDYRSVMQATGQPLDPRMIDAMSHMGTPGGGFVGPGAGGGIPVPVAQQLQVLQPYLETLLPQDQQMLETMIRSGQVKTMDQLVNQIEDAHQRAQVARDPGEVDPQFRVMSIRDHQQELAMLRRHRAQQMGDPFADFDPSQMDELIRYHEESISQLKNAQTSSGESGSGGPGRSDEQVVVTNGRETYRISRSDLGAAQAEGFREAR